MSDHPAWVAPPNWPAPPPGWHREPAFVPDPEWGPAPDGWVFRPHELRRAKLLAVADLALTGGFAAVYLALIRSQGTAPAYWFVAALAVAALCAVPAAWKGSAKPLIPNIAILATGALLGLLTIGALLIPAVVLGAASYGMASRARQA